MTFLFPIDDAPRTMPLIVILIPFVMIMKVREFNALVESAACAIEPAIRNAGRLPRNVRVEFLEAVACPGGART